MGGGGHDGADIGSGEQQVEGQEDGGVGDGDMVGQKRKRLHKSSDAAAQDEGVEGNENAAGAEAEGNADAADEEVKNPTQLKRKRTVDDEENEQ